MSIVARRGRCCDEFRTDEEDVSEDADAVFMADEVDGAEVADSRAASEEASPGQTQTRDLILVPQRANFSRIQSHTQTI